jgi:hypothetical protein
VSAETPLARLIALVDRLEDAPAPYLTLERVQKLAAADQLVAGCIPEALEDAVLLVDHRQDVDGNQVTLCRLNRRHPRVRELTRW